MDDKTKELVAAAKRHALPDPHDEREVMHAPLLRSLAEAIERLSAENEQLKAELLRHTLAALKFEEELAELKSASAEPVAYLAGGTRYKVAQLNGSCGIFGLPEELAGEWVALVEATDDCHMRKTAPAAVQEGWQLVPKEPTDEMMSKAAKVDLGADTDERGICCNLYLAMLAAAPKPPVQEDAKDAARYRFIRKEHLEKRKEWCSKADYVFDEKEESNTFDENTDAAMKESNHAKP